MQIIIGSVPHRISFEFTLDESLSIGLLFSGGLDSTALLILILEELKQTDRLDKVKINLLTQYKNTQETLYAARMLSKIKERYSQANFVHHNHIENSFLNTQVGLMDINLVRPKFVDLGLERVYAAFTNETPRNQKTFEGKLGFRYPQYKDIVSPFLDLTKHQILEIYQLFEHKDLIPYTHTCSKEDYTNCNKCYSCNERAWAFSRLGWTDSFIPLLIFDKQES